MFGISSIPGGGGLGVAVAWLQVGGGGVVSGVWSIPDGGGLGVAVAWPQAGGEGIAFGICWIGGGKDVGVEFMCASLLDEGCIGLESFGSGAGCASLLDVLGTLSGVNGSACEGCGIADVGRVG